MGCGPSSGRHPVGISAQRDESNTSSQGDVMPRMPDAVNTGQVESRSREIHPRTSRDNQSDVHREEEPEISRLPSTLELEEQILSEFGVSTPKSSSRTHESHKNGHDTTPLHPVIEGRVCTFDLKVHFCII